MNLEGGVWQPKANCNSASFWAKLQDDGRGCNPASICNQQQRAIDRSNLVDEGRVVMVRRKKTKPIVSAFRLVLVEWEDSARPIPAWQWVEDYKLPETVTCISVGYMIAETDKAIALAPNLGDITQAKAQACGIIRIPRRAIVRSWVL